MFDSEEYNLSLILRKEKAFTVTQAIAILNKRKVVVLEIIKNLQEAGFIYESFNTYIVKKPLN